VTTGRTSKNAGERDILFRNSCWVDLFTLILIKIYSELMSMIVLVVRPCSSEKPDAAEEHMASILRVKEYAKHETDRKLALLHAGFRLG
jgi:hypothetical protein